MTSSDDIIQYSEATIEFFMVLSADHLSGATGKVPAIQLSKNGAAFAPAVGTVTEVGFGWYSIALAAIDSSVVGTLIFNVAAADCDTVDFAKEVITQDYATSQSPAESTSDSYISASSADLYFDNRLDSEIWAEESTANKDKALKTATRYIDRLNYTGDRTVATQTFEFPRGGDLVVPQSIQDATCEIAFALLDGRNVEYEAEMGNLESSAFGGGRLRHESDWIPEAKAHGIPSNVAWLMLKPYLRDGSHFTLNRST